MIMLGTYNNACIVTSTYVKVNNKPMAFNYLHVVTNAD